MKDQTYRVYGYRWVVLGVFMFVNLTMQMLWITFCPHHRSSGQILRGDRLADWFLGNVLHDHLSFPLLPGLVGDRTGMAFAWRSALGLC